jgi:hypothetical protein
MHSSFVTQKDKRANKQAKEENHCTHKPQLNRPLYVDPILEEGV